MVVREHESGFGYAIYFFGFLVDICLVSNWYLPAWRKQTALNYKLCRNAKMHKNHCWMVNAQLNWKCRIRCFSFMGEEKRFLILYQWYMFALEKIVALEFKRSNDMSITMCQEKLFLYIWNIIIKEFIKNTLFETTFYIS